MANDREQRDQQDRSNKDQDQKSGRREIGEGMHSLDSTQVPLKSENAEPDWDGVSDERREELENEDESSR